MSKLPSIETQLRTAKRQIKDLERYLRDAKSEAYPLRREIERLRSIGGIMSNICFNLGQDGNSEGQRLEPHTRETMRGLRKAWDDIGRAI